jgi:hypothetical protein
VGYNGFGGNPVITIVIASCLNHPIRKDCLLRTVSSLKETFPEAEFLIGFDKFGEEIEGCKCHIHERGLGHSWNWGIQEATNDFILQTEDDWDILVDKNELRRNVEEQIKVIDKYSGIFRLDNMNHSWWESGCTPRVNENFLFLELNRPVEVLDFEKTLQFYYYCNHPHLKKKNLHEKVGYFVEDQPPHVVEFDMCDKYLKSGERVFFQPFNSFAHIGEGISAREK